MSCSSKRSGVFQDGVASSTLLVSACQSGDSAEHAFEVVSVAAAKPVLPQLRSGCQADSSSPMAAAFSVDLDVAPACHSPGAVLGKLTSRASHVEGIDNSKQLRC